MFSRIDRCSSDVSCVTTETAPRRLSCVTRATSWPSIRMRPPSSSWKRSSRLTSVVLPAPERPTSPTFSPARMRRSRSSIRPDASAVAEADGVEADLAAAHREFARVGAVLQGDGPGDGHHALLDGAEVLEDVGDLHGDPAGRRGDLPGERDRHGDGADVDRAAPPEQDGQRHLAEQHDGVEASAARSSAPTSCATGGGTRACGHPPRRARRRSSWCSRAKSFRVRMLV